MRVRIRSWVINCDSGAGEVDVAVSVRPQASGSNTKGSLRQHFAGSSRSRSVKKKSLFLPLQIDGPPSPKCGRMIRSAESIAELGQDVLRILWLVRRLKEGAGSETAVCVVTPASAVEVVSALLILTLIAAPPASPCSASKALVTMFTSWMASAGGT